MKILPAIMSGGAGSRLWPLSRECHPKPFINLPNLGTLIENTYARAVSLSTTNTVITVTNRELYFATSASYANVCAQVFNTYLLEPCARDTASAITLAALYTDGTFGHDTVLLIMPADHIIKDEDLFSKAVHFAALRALAGKIVTFGISPKRPETGYGYIEIEGEKVIRFIEKPSLQKAKEYLNDNRYLWNSGIFCMTAGTALKAIETYCPSLMSSTRSSLSQSNTTNSNTYSVVDIHASYAEIPAQSFDYAIMEKASNISCIKIDPGWLDIGSWNQLSDYFPLDGEGNKIFGEVITEVTNNCFIHSPDQLTSLIGVEDLIVINTSDALLIVNKDYTQFVKRIYNRLRETAHPTTQIHNTVHRPWGTYTVIDESKGFKTKRITVKAGGKLSLQSHQHRSEHWIVVKGVARVINGTKELFLNVDQSTHIPRGEIHMLENPTAEPLIIIEIQSGDYLEEDDITRYDDFYGRHM